MCVSVPQIGKFLQSVKQEPELGQEFYAGEESGVLVAIRDGAGVPNENQEAWDDLIDKSTEQLRTAISGVELFQKYKGDHKLFVSDLEKVLTDHHISWHLFKHMFQAAGYENNV